MKKYIFVVLFGILTLSSCKKDVLNTGTSIYSKYTWSENPCEDEIPGSLSIDGAPGTQYRYPVFNPENQFEFIYYQYDLDSTKTVRSNFKLVKYNMLSKEKQVILEDFEFIGPVAWNIHGQIAFIKFFNPGGRVYSMNDDGSNLAIQLNTQSIQNSNVNWALDGKSIYCQISIDKAWNDKTYYLLEKNLLSNTIDSLEVPYQLLMTDISSKNELVDFQGNGYYSIMNLSKGLASKSVKVLDEPLFPNYGIGCNKKGTKFYVSARNFAPPSQGGIYEIDIKQNKATKIFNMCKMGYIDYLSVSPSENHLLIEKRGIMENATPFEIWLVDINEETETRIIGD